MCLLHEQAKSSPRFFDFLTKAHSRPFLFGHGKSLSENYDTVSIAFIDIDNFKGCNDQYGHEVGDEVLRITAGHIMEFIQGCSEAFYLARYGGEEFVAVFPTLGLSEAGELVESLRQSLSDRSVLTSKNIRVGVTASFGLANYPAHSGG